MLNPHMTLPSLCKLFIFAYLLMLFHFWRSADSTSLARELPNHYNKPMMVVSLQRRRLTKWLLQGAISLGFVTPPPFPPSDSSSQKQSLACLFHVNTKCDATDMKSTDKSIFWKQQSNSFSCIWFHKSEPSFASSRVSVMHPHPTSCLSTCTTPVPHAAFANSIWAALSLE